jgi:hypothetical protein
MDTIIFYSWQSDLPNTTNRSFILTSLEKVAKQIRRDHTIEDAPRIDRDTLGVAGSPDIAQTIFSKIRSSEIFVCDVSIINQGSKFKRTPNPNVLIELGYAMMALGPQRIVMVFNTAFGKPEQLPFDLQRIRLLTYHLPLGEDKAKARKELEDKLNHSIRLIISTVESREQRVDFSGADLAYRVAFRPRPNSSRGSNWLSYDMLLELTSQNNISSENGVARITVAKPMLFGGDLFRGFNVVIEDTGFFLDGREEDPHAQRVKIEWNSNRGTTIFPGDWYNFNNHSFPFDMPGFQYIQSPLFLVKLELLTTNSPTKTYILYIRQVNQGAEFMIGVLDKNNEELIMNEFWTTYWKGLEFLREERNRLSALRVGHKENVWKDI